jgi:membrane-bound serine protease (ClpP class)
MRSRFTINRFSTVPVPPSPRQRSSGNLYDVTKRLIGALTLVAAVLAPAAMASPHVRAVHFDTEVNPVTQDYLSHQLQTAADQHDSAVVIVLDTPGGLSESMRKIVQKELGLPIPVIVYVSPPGARAASAGVWISEAADVVAMAPETNIGSSTPIDSNGSNISSDLRRKVINDAAASLRALMKAHGRNAAWGDLAVRQASNLTADEAKRMNVIDLISPSLPALLKTIDGRTIDAAGRHFVLHTAGATISEAHMGLFTRVLNALIDPNIIFILFLAGLAGIGFEIFHPGIVLPGALGVVSLLTALFGFSVLPISWVGLLLILLGVGLLVIDAHVTTHGALSVSGLISLVIGALMLFHNAPSPYHTSVPLVASLAVLIGGFWAFAMTKAVQVRRRPVAIGPREIVGQTGEVRGDYVAVRGELWQARTSDGSRLSPGQRVVIEDIEGLALVVRPVVEHAQVT